MILIIGREYEMQRLRELRNKKSASLIVRKGRRRNGKSRLRDIITFFTQIS